MSFWQAEQVKATVGGAWLVRPDAAGLPSSIEYQGVSTDTRTIKPGQIFFALRGEKFDANAYLPQASRAGASLAVVDNPGALPANVVAEAPGMAVMHVADSNLALLKLAAAWRRALEGTRVIAVTGSNGKTTTTRMIETLLTQSLRGTASIKSFNNRVGVPLTILRARKGEQFLLCEVGTNAIGEIAELAPVVQPDITVITSIGREHLEGLGSVRGAAQEAVTLLRDQRPGALGIVTSDSPELDELIRMLPGRAPGSIIRFGEVDGADMRLTAIEPHSTGVRFCINGRDRYHVPLLGRHNAFNAAAAVTVARRFGLSKEQIDAGLALVRPAEMRMQPVEVVTARGPIRVVLDCYNANPESMLAAIGALGDVFPDAEPSSIESCARRVVVFGDMLELGEAGASSHAEVVRAIAAAGRVDLCILIGPLMAGAAHEATARLGPQRVLVLGAADADGFEKAASMIEPGDAVLVKGSRGMALERIVPAIRARHVVGEHVEHKPAEPCATAPGAGGVRGAG